MDFALLLCDVVAIRVDRIVNHGMLFYAMELVFILMVDIVLFYYFVCDFGACIECVGGGWVCLLLVLGGDFCDFDFVCVEVVVNGVLDGLVIFVEVLVLMLWFWWIYSLFVGIDDFVFVELHACGCVLINSVGVYVLVLVEYVVVVMVMFVRWMLGWLSDQCECAWWLLFVLFGFELCGKWVVIFGYGGVGCYFVGLCCAIGMEVWVLCVFVGLVVGELVDCFLFGG